ncbi:MAG: hypothetical protein M0T83_10025 [Nitrospiraceae bacterium]|nr:hypothetical protein [Nitrospiraceae bacterium]
MCGLSVRWRGVLKGCSGDRCFRPSCHELRELSTVPACVEDGTVLLVSGRIVDLYDVLSLVL